MDLFDYMRENNMQKESPLASRMRPETLDEVVGQKHIIAKDKLLYRAIKADKLSSVIFYGPPGTGKTTLAKVIANTTSAQFCQINATVAGKKDMEDVVAKAKDRMAGMGRKTILFVDEIHRFNKGQQDYLQQAIDVLEESQKQAIGIPASAQSQTDTFTSPVSMPSELQQWPVQLHLLSPTAPWLKKANLLVAADCTAYSAGDFHTNWLRGKRLAIACPKLDHGQEIYLEKLITMIDEGGIDTLTVMIMEVPCCSGLLHLCQKARQKAKRNIPLKMVKISLQGEILEEIWL